MLCVQFLGHVQDTGCRDENRAVSTHNHADHQRENESFDVVPAEQEDGQQHHKRGQGRVDGPAQCAVQSVVHDLLIRMLAAEKADILTNPVKNNHGVIDGVTYNCQNRGDKSLVNFHREGKDAPENAEEAQHNKDIVNHGNQSTQAILPLSEPKEDVQEDDDEREHSSILGTIPKVI